MKNRDTLSDNVNSTPEWYWSLGLHDAQITSIEEMEFEFDYEQLIADKKGYNSNLLTLKIDAEGAIYDQAVTQIRLFNYKILSGNIPKDSKKEVWWLGDILDCHDGYYTLDIDWTYCRLTENVKIKFERAEVDRK